MRYFKIKKLDILLLSIIILLSFVPTATYAYLDRNESGTKYLSIQINGEEAQRIKLTGNTKTYTIPIHQDSGYENTVGIDHEVVKMQEANCPDQLCVHFQPTTRDGETITCLPHRVVLQIVGGESIQDEGDIISY